MKAMILAAGRGERMLPLTRTTPKPLLKVGGKPLIEYQIEHLARAGFVELIINISHLGQQIEDYCGDGARWGVAIDYSREESPLETAGGIVRALPDLGEGNFLVINGDIFTHYPFEQLRQVFVAPGAAHLVMVSNPPQHAQGDFLLSDDGQLGFRVAQEVGVTYAGIGIYSPSFFAGLADQKLALRPLLDQAIEVSSLRGEFYAGKWVDVGTPERLAQLDAACS